MDEQNYLRVIAPTVQRSHSRARAVTRNQVTISATVKWKISTIQLVIATCTSRGDVKEVNI